MNPFEKREMPAALLNPPSVTPAATLPDPNDPAVLEAKRRAQMAKLSTSGRDSTILTGRSNAKASVPSFDSYASPTL